MTSFSVSIFKLYCLLRRFRCEAIELSASTRQRSAAIAVTAPLKYDANNSVQNNVYKTVKVVIWGCIERTC